VKLFSLYFAKIMAITDYFKEFLKNIIQEISKIYEFWVWCHISLFENYLKTHFFEHINTLNSSLLMLFAKSEFFKILNFKTLLKKFQNIFFALNIVFGIKWCKTLKFEKKNKKIGRT
jgi:hypothetical protein